MAAPLTLKDYRAQQEALDRDELGAHARLVELHPELRWWLVARLEVGPSDPALWGAAPNHPELSRRQLRAAYDAARLRQARLRYDKVQMLRRWAWECDGGVGQACVDVLSPPSDDTSDHVARHKHAIEVVAHALRDARWPVHHWGGHLNQHRCVLLRATA